MMVCPTTAPATRTFLPTVVVPALEPTSPSTARTPSRSVMSPSANRAYAKGEVGGPVRWAWDGADQPTQPTRAAAIIVLVILILLLPGARRPGRHGCYSILAQDDLRGACWQSATRERSPAVPPDPPPTRR